MIRANGSLLGALAGLKNVQWQVYETLRHVDPNTSDPAAAKARLEARTLQLEANEKTSDLANALRSSTLDLEA